MELIHEFDVAGSLKPPVVFGSRMFLEIAEGKVSGERLNGTLLSGGGDWIVLGADGWGQVDVRGQIETDDGAYIYTHYTGLLRDMYLNQVQDIKILLESRCTGDWHCLGEYLGAMGISGLINHEVPGPGSAAGYVPSSHVLPLVLMSLLRRTEVGGPARSAP